MQRKSIHIGPDWLFWYLAVKSGFLLYFPRIRSFIRSEKYSDPCRRILLHFFLATLGVTYVLAFQAQ